MRIRSYFCALPLMVAFFILVAVSTFAIGLPVQADTSKPQANTDSCRNFVQQFYDWYLSGAKPKGYMSKYDYALKYKSAIFTPVLRQKLIADEQASAKSPAEIVGLDFDPFLNAQDDPGQLVAKKATMKGANCFVEVFRTSNDAKEGNKPDVMPELTQKDGHWVFVNFHYPPNAAGDNDLLDILKGLAADRAKHR
jgi:Protein of unknown function (DUF3828)